MREIIILAVLAALAVGALFLVGLPSAKVSQNQATAEVEPVGAIETVAPPTTTTVPLPEAARGVAVDPQKGYWVEELGDGLYFLTDGLYTTMFLTTGRGVIAVDAPPSLGARYLDAVAEVTDEPITHVVYSHSHPDHIGAAHLFPADAVYVAHAETAARVADGHHPHREFPWGVFVGGAAVPVPSVTFEDGYALSVGNQTLELSYKGPAHEPGNIYIYAPRQRVLMLVDVIFPGWSPFDALAEAAQSEPFVEAHDDVLDYDFAHFIGGHLNRTGTRADVLAQWEYVHDMRAHAAAALLSVDFSAIAARVGGDNPWRLFKAYLDAVAEECAALTLPKWRDRLGGVETFTFSHCYRLMMGIRLE